MMKNIYTTSNSHKAVKGLLRVSAIIIMVMVWILIDKGNVYGQNAITQAQLSKQDLNQEVSNQTPVFRKGDESQDGGIPIEGNGGNEFTIKPNPVEGELVFDFEFTVKEAVPVIVFDAMGKLVDQTTFEPGINSQKMNFSHLPTGMYIVRLDIAGKTEVRRIVRK